MRSREAAIARENHLMGRFQDLVMAYNDLEDYSNVLHEEVHQLYYQLHPDDAPGAADAEGGVVLADGVNRMQTQRKKQRLCLHQVEILQWVVMCQE